MTGLVYKELPMQAITYITRPEFINAKKLGFKTVRSIVKLLDPNNNDIEGEPLNNDQEITDLFFHKQDLFIKKQDGVIYEVMPINEQRYGKI